MSALNIETKVDSPEKLNAVAGQNTNKFLFAGEVNSIVSFCNMLRSLCIVNASNVKHILDNNTKVELGVIETGTFFDALNEMSATIYIAPVFVTYTIDGIDYVQSFVGTQGIYGQTKKQFVEADFILIYQSDQPVITIIQNRIPVAVTDEITTLTQEDKETILYPIFVTDNDANVLPRIILVENGFNLLNNNRYVIDTTWSKVHAILRVAEGSDWCLPDGDLTSVSLPGVGTHFDLECPANTITVFGKSPYNDSIVVTQQICNPVNGRKTKNISVDYTGNPDAFVRLSNRDKYKTIYPMGFSSPNVTLPIPINIVLDGSSDIIFDHGDEFIIDTTYYKCPANLKIHNLNPSFDISTPFISGTTSSYDADAFIFPCPADTITTLKIDTNDYVIHITQQKNGAIKWK